MKGSSTMCNYPEENNYSPDPERLTEIAEEYKLFVKSLKPKDFEDMSVGELMADEEAQAKRKAQIDALEKAADEAGVDMTDMLNDMRETDGVGNEPLRIVERKPTHDPNFDEIKFNREMSYAELKQLCSNDGMAIEDETVPTLTKETIDAATEAFLDEEDTDEVNEASNTDYCEEDAPDEGVTDQNPYKAALDECIRQYEESQKCSVDAAKIYYDQPKLGSDEWTAKTALEYLQYRKVEQSSVNTDEGQAIIDEVYTQLNENQRLLMMAMAPWLEQAFRDATERAILRKREQEKKVAEEAAEEDSKLAAEKLTAKMEGKTGDWQADRQKAAHDAWREFYDKWDRLPKDIQDTLAKVPDFMLSLNMYREEMKKKQIEELADYDPEQTVNELSKAHEQGNISAADAANVMNEPTMISNFMWNNPEFNKWNQDRVDYSTDNAADIKNRFEDLQKKGVIPPTNHGQYYSPKDQNGKMWFADPSADLGNTLIMGMKPSLYDTVKDGNGTGKGDCKVADVWEQDVARVQQVNKSFKIKPETKPLTPEESLAELMSDIPKAMVDKILAIPSEEWSFTYQCNEFTLRYSMASRDIVMSMTKDAKFSINYINKGLGSVHYIRHFDKLKDITDAGKNSNRLYTWFGKVLATFFSK